MSCVKVQVTETGVRSTGKGAQWIGKGVWHREEMKDGGIIMPQTMRLRSRTEYLEIKSRLFHFFHYIYLWLSGMPCTSFL